MHNITVTNIWANVQLTDIVTYEGNAYCVIRVYRKRNEVTLTPVT